MGDKKSTQKKPFNHVLKVQNGRIDIREVFKRIDKKLTNKQERENGTIS